MPTAVDSHTPGTERMKALEVGRGPVHPSCCCGRARPRTNESAHVPMPATAVALRYYLHPAAHIGMVRGWHSGDALAEGPGCKAVADRSRRDPATAAPVEHTGRIAVDSRMARSPGRARMDCSVRRAENVPGPAKAVVARIEDAASGHKADTASASPAGSGDRVLAADRHIRILARRTQTDTVGRRLPASVSAHEQATGRAQGRWATWSATEDTSRVHPET